jgi:CHAT domain-containing protein
MKGFIFALITIFSLTCNAQIMKELVKQGGKTLIKKDNLQKSTNFVMSQTAKEFEKKRAELDSTDFSYALILSDNSNIFNISQRGENTAKFFTNTKDLFGETLTESERNRRRVDLAEFSYSNGNFSFAESSFKIAKFNYEFNGKTNDINYGRAISGLALLYGTMGRFNLAEVLSIEAIKLREHQSGYGSLAYASSLNNYAVLKVNMGRYNEAEKDFTEVKEIVNETIGTQTLQYAIVLNNEAMLYQSIGRYDQAETMLLEAIKVAEEYQSKKSNNHLKLISNLALLYQASGKFEQAEKTYDNLLNQMSRRLGNDSPEYANVLNNFASLYLEMGKEEKVEDYLLQASEIYRKKFGDENPAYAKSIADLGNYYRYKQRFIEAEPLLEKAMRVRERTLGNEHPRYVDSKEDLAILHWKAGRLDEAAVLYREAMDKSLNFINLYFPPMSEAEKTRYWDLLFPRFQRFYNFAIEASSTNSDLLIEMYDYHLATKALLLSSTNKIKQQILASNDEALIKDYTTWLDQKETLARLYSYSKKDLIEQKINLDSIERATNLTEKSLSERSGDFAKGYSIEKTDYTQLQRLLVDGEAIVDIIRVRKYENNFTDDAQYAAIVLTKGQTKPELILIDNGKQLETRYFKYYNNVTQNKYKDDYSFDQFWAQIDQRLKGVKQIYLSLDGIYTQINLATLQQKDGQYLLNKYDFVLLGNSKDLIAMKSKKATAKSKNAFLLGFPDYGVSKEILPLPGTKIEIEAISKVLKANAYSVNQVMQADASEKNLKSIKGPAIVHIATHGYFLEDSDGNDNLFGVNLESAGKNPLLRSGLMLAGASQTVSGQVPSDLESNDNGILTAYEAMNLNLEGTELIVLSACETGLGDVRAGEGVYGLQRAFQVAGAETLIMSLWKVDDAATQQLMTNFYSNWIKTGNKLKAFKQAQQQLMTKYKEPYYWGAFVMLGM